MSILAIGEVVVDWFSENPGHNLLTAGTFFRALGGNATNFAIGLSRLGHKVRLVGKIGSDFHADYVMNVLKAEKIDLNCVFVSNYPTAQCYITFDETDEPAYANWPNPHAADMLDADDISESLLSGIELMHATGISMMRNPRKAAIEKIIDMCNTKNIAVSFDACFPTGAGDLARQSVEAILYKADLLKFNYRELLFWSQSSEEKSVADLALKLFSKYKPKALIATLSSKGSIIVNEGGTITCEPYKIEASYPVGAGDAFMAGLIHGLKTLVNKISPESLANLSLAEWQEAGCTGNTTGALVTRSKNAFESFPRLKELEICINNGRNK